MALPIISAEQRLSEKRGVKLVLLGKAGIGKTTQLKTLPECAGQQARPQPRAAGQNAGTDEPRRARLSGHRFRVPDPVGEPAGSGRPPCGGGSHPCKNVLRMPLEEGSSGGNCLYSTPRHPVCMNGKNTELAQSLRFQPGCFCNRHDFGVPCQITAVG